MADKEVLNDVAFPIVTTPVGDEWVPTINPAGVRGKIATKNLRKFSDAFLGSFAKLEAAQARGVTAPPRVLFQGDSNVMGQGANSGTTIFTKGFARDFADQCGMKTGSVLGSQGGALNTIAEAEAYNNKLSHTGNFILGSTDSVIGRRLFQTNNATGVLSWAPAEAFNKVRIWYPRNTTLDGTVIVKIDGTTVDTFSMAGSANFLYKEYTTTLGTHTVSITGSSSGQCYVAAMEIWDTTNGPPVYLQGGWYGGKIADQNLTTNPWYSLLELGALAPDYAFLYMTINDIGAATTVSDYYTGIETWVKKARLSADVCLMFGYPSNTAAQLNSTGNHYFDVLKAIAKDYDCSYFDSRLVFGHSFVRAGDLGLTYDNVHPNQAGHDALADALFAFIGDRF